MADKIPFVDFGGAGKLIHFSHANGFPPKVYQHFIDPFLQKHQVIAAKHRPLWGNENPNNVSSWEVFADDLIRFLDERALKNIIGMGHSMGGTSSVIAAIKRPDLFSQLILIDPVIFPWWFIWAARIFPMNWRKKIIPVAKISMKRRDHWASKEELYQLWRTKRVFKRFSDEVLKQFIEHATIVDKRKDGITLAYSKEWETQVYITPPYVFSKLKKIKVPMLIIKGEKTDVISDKIWTNWQNAQPNNHFINFKNAGHLVPLEYPKELAEQIIGIINPPS